MKGKRKVERVVYKARNRRKLAKGKKPGETTAQYLDRILGLAKRSVEKAESPQDAERMLRQLETVAARKAIGPRGIGSLVLDSRKAKTEERKAARRLRDGFGRAKKETRVVRDAHGRFVRLETVEDDG